MATTKHMNLQEIATGAVEWPALINDLINKVEAGRTIKAIAGEALAKGDPFYIKAADNKAWKATNATECLGVWQSVSTAVGAEGFGQVDSVLTFGSWASGNLLLYASSAGALTTTATGNGTPVAITISTTELFIITQLRLKFTDVAALLAAASADVAFNAKKLTGVADPSSAQDAATKSYVDAVASGLDVKASCRAATTANITLSGEQTIDGAAVVAGDRVLVKNQTAGAENGIYAAAAGAWSRATDADVSAEVTAGMFTFVTEGTANGDKGFALVTNDPITLGTTALVFSQFSSGDADTVDGFHAGQTPAANTAAVSESGGKLNVGWIPPFPYIFIRDEKPSTSGGGTFTQDAWQTRDLNTEVVDTDNLASVAANQITLPAGTYRFSARCPAYRVDRHRAKLYNVTAAADIILGSISYISSATGDAVQTDSFVRGRFILSVSSVLELRHYCQTTYVNTGLGLDSSFGGVEVFAEIELWKEA